MPRNDSQFLCSGDGVSGADHHGHVPFKEAKDHGVIVILNLCTRIKVYTAVVQELHELLKSGPHILAD